MGEGDQLQPVRVSVIVPVHNDEVRLALELEYIQNYSLGRDLKFLLQTITAVFKAEGAF
jgi:lipopolysaccharide/colanic/teichoic acid biosynthesis glycosyltransferase